MRIFPSIPTPPRFSPARGQGWGAGPGEAGGVFVNQLTVKYCSGERQSGCVVGGLLPSVDRGLDGSGMFCVTVVRGVVMSDVMELQGDMILYISTRSRARLLIFQVLSLLFFFAQSSHAPQSCGAGHRAIVHCQMRIRCGSRQCTARASSRRRPCRRPRGALYRYHSLKDCCRGRAPAAPRSPGAAPGRR